MFSGISNLDAWLHKHVNLAYVAGTDEIRTHDLLFTRQVL